MKNSPKWNRKPRTENGVVRKRWAGRIPVALVFPDDYAVGMANLGLQTVYGLLNEEDGIVAERFFAPGPAPGGSSRAGAARLPWRSEESNRPLRDFALILFSISFEASYLHVPSALADAGIALNARERGNSEPMVIAGGVAAMINPEPVADFMDAFLLGDFEAISGALFENLPELLDVRRPRLERLRELASRVPGAYVPRGYPPVFLEGGPGAAPSPDPGFPASVRPALVTAQPAVAPHTRILSPDAAFSDMFMVELSRGCGRGCRFCAAGFVYRPPRPWSIEAIQAALRERAGARKVGLVGLEFLGRQEVEHLCGALLDQELSLAFSSLRADAVTPAFAKLLGASGAKVATVAPEAGSQRLRDILNKNLPEAAILEAVETLASAGVPNLKLYFMLGLPFEEDEDVRAIARLVDEIRRTLRPLGRARGRLGTVTVSVGTFVPKAWTPFQWAKIPPEAVLEARRKMLRQELASMPNVRLRLDSLRDAGLQAMLSRGDRRLAPVLAEAGLHGLPWRRVLKEAGLTADVFSEDLPLEQSLPWNIVQHRVKKEYLSQEWQKARQGRQTGFCQPSCKRCGACGEVSPGEKRGANGT